ncbi:hypothetical protein K1T71_011785 [Dendrolimus kikuchii]|uniref:Uncharacterized protein n=1 Tax=Dendrolimus kikuchii TaxID=765133 RepID=A0ACC1CM85_9NEOP|nr:hypothetical protein K1T71_011785 [Dendrolimus kikuchii]
MDLILEVKSSQIEDVVVVTFNDPETKLRIKSRKRNYITEALSIIHAHTDKDYNPCPEYAMSGVYLGLNNSRSGSSLFVFTDSGAEDENLHTEVIDLCQKTQSMVTFIIASGQCMPRPDHQLDVYYKVAKACSGKVMFFNPEEINEVFNWVNIFIQGEISILGTYDLRPSWFPTTRNFTIDEQVEYVLITVTGRARGLKILHNRKSVYGKKIIWAENTKAVQLNNPEPGSYQVEIKDHDKVTIEIAGRTDFTFEHGFSQQQPKTMNDTTKQPIGDINNYLSILVNDPSEAIFIKEVEILSLKDTTIFKIPLIDMGKNFYRTAPFVSPSESFKIAVNGVVKKTGRDISRTAKVPVQPQPKPKVIPNKQPQVTISEDNGKYLVTKYGESIILTCKVSAYPPPNIFWKDSSGKILSKKFSLLLQPYDYVSYLTLNSVTKSEQISCHAENELLSTKKSINIKVNYFQISTPLPDTTEAKYGTSKTIKCDIRSQLPIQTRWYLQKSKSSSKDLLTASSSYKVSADEKELTIVYVNKETAGVYICEATLVGDEEEKATLHTEIKVVGLEVPAIDKRRRSINVFVNTSATIVCKVSKGTPKPQVTWQWKPNNSKWVLLSSIGEKLQIPNVGLPHSGIYKCVAKNSEGIDQHDIKLIVNSRPVIKIDKSSYEVSAGVPFVRIICNVTGYPPPAITWHEGENPIANGASYTIYDGGLLIKNPKESELSNFTCGASNQHGYASEEFQLTVYGAPKIDKSVKHLKAFVNTSPTINCKVTNGIPKPKVSWQWRPKDSTWMPLSEIGEELQLSSVSLSQAGEYKCIAENREGIDHWETTLVVQSPPIIISNKTEYIGVLGDPYLRVACKVIGYPAPIIAWRNKENVIIPGQNYSIDEGDLLIKNPQEMESTFTCAASNEFGSVSKTFAVSVYYHLMDYGEIKNIYKRKGFTPSEDDKKLKCPLPYKTPESVRWFSDGFSINVTGPTINIVNYTDSNYTCRITDKHSLSSYTFVLDIGTPPEFDSNVNDLEWTGLNEEQVNCEVTAKPEAQIEWYYNDKKIDDKNNVQVRPITGWGKYTCRASNVHDTIVKTIVVKSRDCLIKRLDYTQNTPLPLIKVSNRGESALSWPEYVIDNAYYTIGANKTFTLSCTNDDDRPNYFTRFPGIYEIDVTCHHEDNFVINGTMYKSSDLLCDKKVTATLVNTGEICHIEGIHKLKVGFKASKFVELYEACYDSKNAITHSVLSKEGTWGEVGTVPGYESYQYQYNCTKSASTCCYAKSQLLKAEVESYSSGAQLSTYIGKVNFNNVPEWRSCDKGSDAWDYVKQQITTFAINGDVKVISGASYTSATGSRPKYLWQLLMEEEELKFALVHVNDPAPVNEDILCKKPCEGALYESLILDNTDKFTYCCNADEYLEKFIPKAPNGNID